MDWKLGVAMSSSGCRSLNTPHVTLQLQVTESRGTVQYHNIEMSLPEFHVRTYNACPFIHFFMPFNYLSILLYYRILLAS